MNYYDLTIDELNAANDKLGAEIERIRDERRKLVAVRNRKLRVDFLVPLMYSTGRNVQDMRAEVVAKLGLAKKDLTPEQTAEVTEALYQEMERIAGRVKEGKEFSKQAIIKVEAVAMAQGFSVKPAVQT